ncbi:MAG: chorismate mutase, partial [Chloroflexota bacterium]
MSDQTNPSSPILCRGVRGATTAAANTREAILEATTELAEQMIAANDIHPEDVASVFLSMT